jgi:Undecaprenyl-phosphate galactose phosphotransferase WbaP
MRSDEFSTPAEEACPDAVAAAEGHARGLFSPSALRVKRVFDALLSAGFIVLTLPLAALIALAIRLETRGPVFFRHTRIGRNHRPFRLWKFRSMVTNADALLDEYLRNHPELLEEWTLTHKLKQDPRVTRVGRLLRRSSLDELPQLWNVLRGDMSMVGPRPIVEAEIEKYGGAARLYLRVPPGLTGLWQISGRNDTSYRQRVDLDTRYICNWSIGLDLLVLLKTIRVVVLGHGAY